MMKTAGATKEIGIVLYPGVQAACVHGLTDLFGIAAGIASDQRQDSRAALPISLLPMPMRRPLLRAPGKTKRPRPVRGCGSRRISTASRRGYAAVLVTV
jgi:transcriptional regulator GlxA family with amidase domain